MIDIAKMTSPEIGGAIEKGYDTAVFAVGSNEQHGPVLAVSTDTVLGDVLALGVAERLGNALKFPTINIGCSEHHMMFPGTVTLRTETLHMLVKDYVGSLARHGFKQVIIISSHGGSFGPLSEMIGDLETENPDIKIIAYTDLLGFVDHLTRARTKLGISAEASGAHAGEAEVSMMMFANPEGVRVDKIPEAKGYVGVFDEAATQRIFQEGIAGLSSIGVLGDPAEAAKEHGEEYIDAIVSGVVDYIKTQQ